MNNYLIRDLDLTATIKKSKENINRDAIGVMLLNIEQLKEELKEIGKPKFKLISSDTDISKYINYKVRFLGTINSYTQPETLKYMRENDEGESEEEMVPFINLNISLGHNEIKTLCISGREQIDIILPVIKENSQVIVTGFLLNYPTKTSTLKPTLHIQKIRCLDKCLDLISATKKEIIEIKKIIEQEPSLKHFIRKEIKLLTGLKSVGKSKNLNSALDFTIYQALSNGLINSSSAKVHSLLIGAPASGKKLISKSIEYLNPSFCEIGIGKVTLAGLSANTQLKDNEWISKPGALVKAHKGTLICQDFHGVSKSIFTQLMDALSRTMEDGTVLDSTAANIEHKSETAIHLDSNKLSDLQETGPISFHEDISNIPKNILSRFDFITEIEADNLRQQDIAIDMYLKGDVVMSPKEKQLKIRRLKVLIAYLRDEYNDIKVTTKHRKILASLHEELFNKGHLIQNIPELGAFQTRITNSALKLSVTSARLNCRKITTEKDARVAFKFIQKKLEVIEKIIPSFKSNQEKLTGKFLTTSQRKEWIKDKFTGQTVSVKKITREYLKKFKAKSNESIKRAIYRDVKSLGERMGHGKVLIK